jgi:hypothetical protein
MNPNLYEFLAAERIAGFRREADARRLANEATSRASARTRCEPNTA